MRGDGLSGAVDDIQVRHAMTKDVVTVGDNQTLADAAKLMRKHHVSGLPVVRSDRKVVGVLSEKDIAAALDGDSPARFLDLVVNPARLAQAKLDRLREILDSATVAEHMSRDPVVIAPGATLDDAAQLMKERKVNRLPVVEKGRLVGILTRHDVLNAL